MLNLLLLTALTATVLALPAAASYILTVDNLQAIKMSLSGYSVGFQTMRFSIPFPNSPWGANETEYLQLKLGVGKCKTCFDVVFEGAKPEPYPKHFYHPYTQDSSGAIHVAEVTISEFPAETTANDHTGDLHFAISSVDDQPLNNPLAFIVTWNFNKPKQRLGRLVYEPAPQVIEFAELEEFPGYPQVPPLIPNRICKQSRELKLLNQDEKTQNFTFAVTCEACFRSTNNAPDSITFSLQPQPRTKPDQFTFVLNGIQQSILYRGSCATHDGGCRLRVKAPDDFGVLHTIDFGLDSHHEVVEEAYSELGAISPSEKFTVRFRMDSIDGKPPSEQVSFSGQWDLLYKVNKRIPRWQSLALEPTLIRFPWFGGRSDIREASDTLKPLAPVGWTGPLIPSIATYFLTKQCSGRTSNVLLILVAFLAGTAISGYFRRRRLGR